MADRTVDLAELRQRFAEQIDEAASWGWPVATVAIRVDEALAIASLLERIETAARDLDGMIDALWTGRSELRYAEDRLWASVHDARERLRAALDEGGGPRMAEELRWRRAEADILRAEIERLNAENAALRRRLRDKNEILHAYAGPDGMTPEDVAFAVAEAKRLRDLVNRMIPYLEHDDRVGCPMAVHRSDGEQCACGVLAVLREARTIGLPGAPPTPEGT